MGEILNISIWSKEYGFCKLTIDKYGLTVFINSNTEKYNIKERFNYQKDELNLSHYSYQISYCNKKNTTDNKKMTTREISGHQIGEEKLKIYEKTYINDRLHNQKENCVNGTIEEMVIKHEIGIKAFDSFQLLLCKIFSFKKNISNELLTPELISKYNLELFTKNENKSKIYS